MGAVIPGAGLVVYCARFGFSVEIHREIHPRNQDGCNDAERTSQRQVDHLLDEAEAAICAQDWALVRDNTQAVLALDPENADVCTYLEAAERVSPGPALATNALRLD